LEGESGVRERRKKKRVYCKRSGGKKEKKYRLNK
jgi:hypothetical protein